MLDFFEAALRRRNVQASSRGVIALILASSIWGGVYVVSKFVLDYIPPFTLLCLRYFIALTVMLPMTLRMGWQAMEAKDWWLAGIIGTTGYFLSVGAQFIGTHLSSAHMGSLLTSTAPIFTIIFAYLVLKERPSGLQLSAVFISLIGVVVSIRPYGFDHSSNLLGNLMLLLAALTWAVMSVYVKVATVKHTTLQVTTVGLTIALVFGLFPASTENPLATLTLLAKPVILLAVLYIGLFSTALAYFLWNEGMRLLPAGSASLFILLQPVVGSLLGWLLLDEALGLSFLLGGLLIIGGITLAALGESKN